MTDDECDPIIVAECIRTDKPAERFDAEILDDEDDGQETLDAWGRVR